MEPLRRFMRCVYQWLRFLLKCFGHNFLDGQYQRNWMTYLLYASIFIATSIEINTFFDTNNDMATRLFCVYTFSLDIQVNKCNCKSIHVFILFYAIKIFVFRVL